MVSVMRQAADISGRPCGRAGTRWLCATLMEMFDS